MGMFRPRDEWYTSGSEGKHMRTVQPHGGFLRKEAEQGLREVNGKCQGAVPGCRHAVRYWQIKFYIMRYTLWDSPAALELPECLSAAQEETVSKESKADLVSATSFPASLHPSSALPMSPTH